MTFYNEQMVAQKHSVVLARWNAERQASRKELVISNATDSISVKSSNTAEVLSLFDIETDGVSVTPDSSKRLSAVTACVGLLGDAMSTLPLHHYRRGKDGMRERIVGSPIERLFNSSPIENFTSAAMVKFWEACISYRGDAISFIVRDRLGYPIAIVPFHNRDVAWERIGSRLIYRFYPGNGLKPFNASADDVLHLTGEGFDGTRSRSIISNDAYHGIGLGLAISRYGKKFFEKGASPKHVFETDKEMNQTQIDDFRDVYDSRYSGPANTGRPMVLTEGLKMREMNMKAVDAQLLETLKYSVIDIARAFRIPPILIGAQETTTSWGSGVIEIKQGFVTFRLEPKATQYEQEFNRKLIYAGDEFLEYQFAGFLRGNTKEENEALRQAIGGSNGPGWMTINEVRKTKNLAPIEGGDVLYIPKGKTDEQKTNAVD
ncbi:MAG TPA: phage portal protein [Methylophilus sp.]|uniref:phage portal protein n=1 Tax=Methylophilus sp. TaxID=29541 RepID=UPI002CDBD22C|nr:phage portal protein [Methylophilus sp.]HSH86880.1 phage portal protein [Methylophilus sp.]